jgi:hypothetical protein
VVVPSSLRFALDDSGGNTRAGELRESANFA